MEETIHAAVITPDIAFRAWKEPHKRDLYQSKEPKKETIDAAVVTPEIAFRATALHL